jgi:hypothetical protein
MVAVVVALAAGCEVGTEVAVEVAEDGSGRVSVAVSLDPDATARVPGLAAELRVEDLETAGWDVTGPAVEDDGLTWIRASKAFTTPEQAATVLAEVAGTDGPFRDFAVTRDRAVARTTYAVSGTVDLAGGLESFADEQLAAVLGGTPLGESVADIEARAGAPLEDVFTFALAVDLPGEVTSSNATEREGTSLVWRPRLGDAEALDLLARSEERRTGTLVLIGVAVVAALAAVGVGVVAPLVGWRRRRHLRPRGRHSRSELRLGRRRRR